MIEKAMSHIEKMIVESGISFDPAIDLRKDLYIHYGYTIEELAFMSDDQVFAAIDGIKDAEKGVIKHKEIVQFICSKCSNKGMEVVNYSDITDRYEIKCCKCNHTIHIHYTTYDSYMEAIEEEENDQQIEKLDFSIRTKSVLKRHDVNTIGDLRKLTLKELMLMRNMGRNSIREIEEKLDVKYDW